MASTKTPTSASNGRGASGRLPSTRERRPALAALAILLILGGALASAWLAMRAGDREEYVQVSAEVGQGQEIKDGDLTTVQLPEDFEGGIPESDKDDIVGSYAATPWTPGMVLTTSMVTDQNALTDKYYEFAVPIAASQIANLTAGTNIVVFTGAGEPIAGTVSADPETESDSTGEQASVQATVSASCGDQIATALNEDVIQVAKAGAPDTEEALEAC